MHMLDSELLLRSVRVLLIGCGGSGSAVAGGLPYLHQAMLIAGHPGGLHVTVMDGDIITATNCVRQPFCSAEIGLAKAVVTVSRMNLFWGLNWTAVTEHLTSQADISNFDIVIGCVDTRAARQLIASKVQGWRSRIAYWLDLGNSSVGAQLHPSSPESSRPECGGSAVAASPTWASTGRYRVAPRLLRPGLTRTNREASRHDQMRPGSRRRESIG